MAGCLFEGFKMCVNEKSFAKEVGNTGGKKRENLWRFNWG